MKKIFLTLIFTLLISTPAFAEKIPVRLENTYLISTHHDEVQLGDLIPFKVVNDVYLDKKLYIKKDTKCIGLVDFIQDNGWAGYSAEVRFKTFITKDVITLDGNIETFTSTMQKKSKSSIFYIILNALSFARGHELGIKPGQASFNIFIEK